MPVEISPEIVRGLWRHMGERYKSTVVPKSSSSLMKAAAVGLEVLGISSRDSFMCTMATTVGRIIYLPFSVGVETPIWDLWTQVAICIHEHQHIVQWNRHGLWLPIKYLMSCRARAFYEADAYSCELALEYWRTGVMPSISALATWLERYGCAQEDVQAAEHEFAEYAANIRLGKPNEASLVAISWLAANAIVFHALD